jgi:hypothetical protein
VADTFQQTPTEPGRFALVGRVCERCVSDLEVDHAAVAIATPDGLWSPAYATSTVAADLEQHAFTVGEGPCFDTLRDHSPALASDLSGGGPAAARWPIWSQAARSAGIRSVTALPIQAGAVAAGALTLMSSSPGVLSGARLALALRLSDVLFLALLDIAAGLVESGDGVQHEIEQAEVAALVRADVHQAAGMIMAQAGVSIGDALARLRARSFSTGQPIAAVARDVLARRVRFDSDSDSAEWA